MKTTIDKDLRHGLLIDEDSLQSLVNFLRTKYEVIEFEANCIDGSKLETKVVEDVLTFDNHSYRRFVGLKITAWVKKSEDYCYISVDSRKYHEGIVTRIVSLSDEKAVFVSREVQHQLKEMKPWYNCIVRFKFSWLIGGLALTYSMIATAKMLFLDEKSSELLAKYSAIETVNIAILISLMYFVVLTPLDYAQEKLFPKIFFNIGKQNLVLRKIEAIRTWIFGGIILAIITGIIGNALSSMLLK